MVTSGYLVVTSGYLIVTIGYFSLLLVVSGYFSLLLGSSFQKQGSFFEKSKKTYRQQEQGTPDEMLVTPVSVFKANSQVYISKF